MSPSAFPPRCVGAMRNSPLPQRGCQSTLPVRGATVADSLQLLYHPISIHAPREGSDEILPKDFGRHGISIHAPREGSDWGHTVALAFQCISIHAPREGSDAVQAAIDRCFQIFQSTLPVRGATRPGDLFQRTDRISIHAPREGSDPFCIPL